MLIASRSNYVRSIALSNSQRSNLSESHALSDERHIWECAVLNKGTSSLLPIVRRSHGGPAPFGVGLGVIRVSLAITQY